MNIKKEVIKLCNDMIDFWNRLEREIQSIPNEDKAEIVRRWNNYFPENSNTTINLINTKMNIEMIEKELIEESVSKYSA